MQGVTLLAYLVTFIASFFIMVIELVAGRIMAPYIGQHLYSWTSIIGVCLAGISFGAFFGGWIADKYPRRSTLGWILLIAGILALLIPLLTDSIAGFRYVDSEGHTKGWLENQISLMWRIVIYTTLIFFPASFLLGMVSPTVIKLVIRDLSNTGSVVGRIYAFSTIGSIIGTFATGFFLIEEFGTRSLLYCVGGLLVLMAPLVGGLFGRAAKGITLVLCGLLLVGIALLIVQPSWYFKSRDWVKDHLSHAVAIYYAPNQQFPFKLKFRDSDYVTVRESNYYTLKVSSEPTTDNFTGETRQCNNLILDNLIHSHTDPGDPTFLAYEYLRIYEELIEWQLKKRGSTKHRELFIGGGGYTMQRFFHFMYKDCHIDVVEIDPQVTQVAEEYMYAPKNDPRLVTTNEDGRLFVLQQQRSGTKYDFIFGDAFNDLSIPFHLTTKEFDEQLKNLLTDNGLLMSLVIDNPNKGLFLPAYLQTARAAFGAENVGLIVDEIRAKGTPIEDIDRRTTVIVVASKNKIVWDNFEAYLEQREQSGQPAISRIFRPEQIDKYLQTRTRQPNWVERLLGRADPIPWTPPVLTDDYAPVDNLTAPMFEEAFGFKKKENTQISKPQKQPDEKTKPIAQ
jgi:spermidine synthase/MFS family permease